MFGFGNNGTFFSINIARPEERVAPKEGDLFKVIVAHGKTFELRYGYYSDSDRDNPHIEPMEMYPNFIENPQYTAEGVPFVTALQKNCEHFKGEPNEDNTCYQCSYYEKCEELLGVCRCKARRKKNH